MSWEGRDIIESAQCMWIPDKAPGHLVEEFDTFWEASRTKEAWVEEGKVLASVKKSTEERRRVSGARGEM